jgi:hypothetical protein
MKSFKIIIAVGVLNLIHGGIHIFQFLQSVLLTYYSLNHTENETMEKIMESPWMALLWGALGIMTLWIGIRDYKHHKHHKD